MLNTHSPIPLYRQLADLLTARIRAGEYAAGSRLPSEHQMAAALGIGRPTVRQATDMLVRKGLLTRRRGSGTYVCPPQQEVDLFSLEGTRASFQKKGIPIRSQIVAPVALESVAADPDNPFAGRQAYYFRRLTLAEETPVLLEDLFLDPALFAGIEHIDLAARSLAAVADEHFYLRPSGGRQRFSIGYADEKRARLLQVAPTTPLLKVQRLLHFAQSETGVFAELWCRTDHFVFAQTLGGSAYA